MRIGRVPAERSGAPRRPPVGEAGGPGPAGPRALLHGGGAGARWAEGSMTRVKTHEELISIMGYYHGGWGLGEWLAMSAMMLVVWGSLIALLLWAARNFRSGAGQAGSRGAGPDKVLAERFARGDIDEDEFRRRLELLQSTRGVSR